MLYGIGKTFNILDLRAQLSSNSLPGSYLWVSFGLIFTAVAARMAAFPFQAFFSDIIEGAPSPVSAFISVSSFAAAMAFALRLCLHIFSVKGEMKWAPLTGFSWPELIAGVAAATMTIGNLTALFQTNLKRLIAYSCIAQTGFFLMGLVVSNHAGVASVLFSMATYGVMTLGAFFVIQMVSDHAKSEKITVLRGLVWKNPFEGVILCLFLVGLAGIPPLVGFVGRFYLLGLVIKEKVYWLAVIAVVNWVVGLTYYLSMIHQIFASGENSEDVSHNLVIASRPMVYLALALLVVPTVALGIYWDPMMNYITQSLNIVTW
jgi:NADH-quinone oxidoreductase subunit N